MGEPNELPEGGEGGGSGIFGGGIRGEWPAELPVGPDVTALQAILSELSRLQVRLQTLEGARLQAQVLSGGLHVNAGFGGAGAVQARAFYRPNELPEGGEGGGATFPGGGIRGEYPQELPQAELGMEVVRQLVERVAGLESLLNERFGAIEAKLDAIGR